mmetsp:Transcript_39047/g.125521  ORF Transcript_39047/g.125521 Transcript_39047/m.125521 type:complete len:184 (+) Transcript_39047:590-1141(+)
MAPLAITSIIDHLFWAPVFVFVPVFGTHALNFISIELEENTESSVEWDSGQFGAEAPPTESAGPGSDLIVPKAADDNSTADALGCRPQIAGPGGRFQFPEPKLLQNKELEALLTKSMEEFNTSLQLWTQKLEEQVKDMSQAFHTIGSCSHPPARRRRLEAAKEALRKLTGKRSQRPQLPTGVL